MYKFDPLIPEKYNLNPLETLAYQCCVVYLTLAYKVFPNYRHCKIPKTGNIKKSSLFKHCYKMCVNLEGKIKKEYYPLFIKAQFDIFNTIYKATGLCPIIAPSIISGKKSFNRWLVWRNRYESIKVIKTENTTVNAERQLLINEFLKTLKFMHSNSYAFENFNTFNENYKDVFKFVILKKISPYYIALSPWIEKLPEKIREEIYNISNSETIKEIMSQDDKNLHHYYFKNEYA
jgi:hypothetical protein